eukprot:SAG31_NODE_4321_length_3360_cov_3.636308_2_plen_43_part_00
MGLAPLAKIINVALTAAADASVEQAADHSLSYGLISVTAAIC